MTPDRSQPDLSGRGISLRERLAKVFTTFVMCGRTPTAERVAERMSPSPPGMVMDRLAVIGGEVLIVARPDGRFQFLHYVINRNPPKALQVDIFATAVHASGLYSTEWEVRAAATDFINAGLTAGHVRSLAGD